MNVKNIWQKLVSLKDRAISRFQGSSKNKAMIQDMLNLARYSIARAYKEKPVATEDDVQQHPDEKKEGSSLPPYLSSILQSAQNGSVDQSLSQSARTRNFYGTEALGAVAKRFFADPRIKEIFPSGNDQLLSDIRFVSDEKIDEIDPVGTDYPDTERGIYLVLSSAFLKAADPKSAPLHTTQLQGDLRTYGIFWGEPIVKRIEKVLEEYTDALKNPSNKIVRLRKPRDPDGMK